MKKILILFVFIVLASIQSNHAQTSEGDIAIGGGLAFGTGALMEVPGPGGDLNNSIGIQLGGYYTISETIRAGLDFIYYLPASESVEDFGVTIEEDLNVFEINANAHYIFVDESDFLVYGLGGLNITSVKTEVEAEDSEGLIEEGVDGIDASEIGLNLGGGIESEIDFGILYGEVKYANLGGDADQLVISAGLRFLLD